MRRTTALAVLAVTAAVVVTLAVVLYELPLLQPVRRAPAIPSVLPLPAGISFPLLPDRLFNGTTTYVRVFSTNLTGSCQFVQGSWAATAPTTTFQGTGTDGTFHSYVFPVGTIYNGSLVFESPVPDTIRVNQTIQAVQPSPCNPPVVLGPWSIYNSGTMCSSGTPSPPWELKYDFVLKNVGDVGTVVAVDFFLTRNATGMGYDLEQSTTYTVPPRATENLTATVYYLDCPWGTGGWGNLAIVDEWPAAP